MADGHVIGFLRKYILLQRDIANLLK